MFGTPFGKLKVGKSFQFQNNYGTFSEKSSSKGSNKVCMGRLTKKK